RVDTLLVVWPDRRFQLLSGVTVDTDLTLWQNQAGGQYPAPSEATPLLEEVADRAGLHFEHAENPFFDYNREPLIPRLLSREGPALAAADVNGDGLDDLYFGGAKWQSGALFLQLSDGT